MATGLTEVIPASLDSSSEAPAVFDGTTRLYTAYVCPYAHRVWIARNYKGLQDQIKLVPLNMSERPSWYKDKVYPPNKVPSLEHNNQVRGESLDILKYLEDNFDGPSLLPRGPAKGEFGEELLAYCETFNRSVISSLREDDLSKTGAAFDYIEKALGILEDGPFFLGGFTLVDVAYAPFIERYQVYLSEVKKYDITQGRPKLGDWIEEINKMEAYKVTKCDPKDILEIYTKYVVGRAAS